MGKVTIRTEQERMDAALSFIKNQIAELQREINECDYYEDVNGNMVYEPNSYAAEKREFEAEKRNWEIMLDILTRDCPFTMLDW